MVKFILCNGCGNVFSRTMRTCPECRRTDFSYYNDASDPELEAKRQALTGKSAPGSTIASLLYVAAAVVIVGGAGTLYGVLTGINPHVVKTPEARTVAATADSIPH